MSILGIVKLSLDKIYNKKIRFFITSLLVVISILLMFNALSAIASLRYEIWNVNKKLGDHREKLYKVKSDFMTRDLNYYNNAFDKVIDLKNEEGCISYEITNTRLTDGKIVSAIRTDNKFIEIMGVKDTNGENIVLNSDGEYKEVAIGYKMVERGWKLGTVFEDNELHQKYKVAYIIKEGEDWLPDSLFQNDKFVDLDDMLLLPQEIEHYENGFPIILCNRLFFYGSKEEVKNFNDKIENLRNQNVYFECISFDDYEKESNKTNYNIWILNIVLSIISVLLMIMALFISFSLGWLEDSGEFGIFLANGLSMRDICLMMQTDMMVRALIPIAISYLFLFLKGDFTSLYGNTNKNIFMVITISLIVIVQMFTFAMYKWIKANKVIRMMKEGTV